MVIWDVGSTAGLARICHSVRDTVIYSLLERNCHLYIFKIATVVYVLIYIVQCIHSGFTFKAIYCVHEFLQFSRIWLGFIACIGCEVKTTSTYLKMHKKYNHYQTFFNLLNNRTYLVYRKAVSCDNLGYGLKYWSGSDL